MTDETRRDARSSDDVLTVIARFLADQPGSGGEEFHWTAYMPDAKALRNLLHAAGYQIVERGRVTISRYDAVTASICVRGIAKQHQDLGNAADDQIACAERLDAAIAAAETEPEGRV